MKLRAAGVVASLLLMVVGLTSCSESIEDKREAALAEVSQMSGYADSGRREVEVAIRNATTPEEIERIRVEAREWNTKTTSAGADRDEQFIGITGVELHLIGVSDDVPLTLDEEEVLVFNPDGSVTSTPGLGQVLEAVTWQRNVGSLTLTLCDAGGECGTYWLSPVEGVDGEWLLRLATPGPWGQYKFKVGDAW